VLLIPILMQRQTRSRLIPVDETGIWSKTIVACSAGSLRGELEEYRRHRRPRLTAEGIDRIVPVTAAIGDPSRGAAVGHGNRHAIPALRGHQPKSRLPGHTSHGGKQRFRECQCCSSQNQRAGAQLLMPGVYVGDALEEIQHHVVSYSREALKSLRDADSEIRSDKMSWLVPTILVLLGLYLVMCCVLYAAQNRLLYFPTPEAQPT